METNHSTITKMTNHNHHLTAQLNLTLSGLCIATDNIAALQAQLNALISNGTGGGGRAIGSSNFRGTGNTTGGGDKPQLVRRGTMPYPTILSASPTRYTPSPLRWKPITPLSLR